MAKSIVRHVTEFVLTGPLADLDAAIAACQEAVAQTPTGTQEYSRNLNSLGLGWAARYMHTGELSDLRQAVRAHRHAVAACQHDWLDYTKLNGNLGGALGELYGQTNNPAHLDQAIRAYKEALKAPGWQAEAPLGFLRDLSNLLQWRFDLGGNLNDLNDLISVDRELARLIPPTDPAYGEVDGQLGFALLQRFQRASRPEDLEAAIASSREAAARVSSDSPQWFCYQINLGSSLMLRYEMHNGPADLDTAIAAYQQGLASAPDGFEEQAEGWFALGRCLLFRRERTHDPADLTSASEAFRHATEAAQKDTPTRDLMMASYGQCRLEIYRASHQLEDLEQAIDALMQAHPCADSASRGDPVFDMHLVYDLALALYNRIDLCSQPEDVDHLIEIYCRLVSLPDLDLEMRRKILTNLGLAYHLRHSLHGALSDLDTSAVLLQEALDLTRPGDPERPASFNNLGNTWFSKYARTGELQFLHQAIASWRQAVDLTQLGCPQQATRLINLGDGLRTRFSYSKNPEDLAAGISALRQGLDAAEQGSIDLGRGSFFLGMALMVRYEQEGGPEHLEDSIRALQMAHSLRGLFDVRERSDISALLGQALGLRFAIAGNEADLDAAIECIANSRANAPPAYFQRAGYLGIRGDCLHARYRTHNQTADLDAAIDAYRQACQLGSAFQPQVSLLISKKWGAWAAARGQWSEAAEAYRFGEEAIDQLFKTQLFRQDKEQWLQEAQALYPEAAYALMQVNAIREAVVMLEHGRARLLAEALERSRSDVENLRLTGSEELYQDYREALERLHYLEKMYLHPDMLPPGFDLIAKARQIRGTLDAAVARIQRIPGYEGLFARPTFQEIRDAWGAGEAGVYLFTAMRGSYALLVTGKGVQPIELGITTEELDGWLVKGDRSVAAGGFLLGQLGIKPMPDELDDLLPILGCKVVLPLASALLKANISTVILIPTGRLALLPLHIAPIAGPVSGVRPSSTPACLLDEFTVHYSPSSRAFSHSKLVVTGRDPEPPALLGVGNPLPLPQGAAGLAYARPEVEEIARLFPESRLLCEAEATRAAVVERLGTTSYLHMACHGLFNPRDPPASGVMLSGGEMLTLADLIAGQQVGRARLVVLSACQTAITDFNLLPEEAVGLPAGFLQAGAAAVVGSLWPVNDLSTALLMIQFYTYHRKDGLRPAEALRKAQHWLQSVTNAKLSDLLDQYRQAPGGAQDRLIYQLARARLREDTLADPDEQPFAHPYYWGGFAFFGT